MAISATKKISFVKNTYSFWLGISKNLITLNGIIQRLF
jgi:hypothetical protein